MAQQRDYTVEEQLTERVSVRMWWEVDYDLDLSWLEESWDNLYKEARQERKKDGNLVSDRYARGLATYRQHQNEEELRLITEGYIDSVRLCADLVIASENGGEIVIETYCDGIEWFNSCTSEDRRRSQEALDMAEQADLARIRRDLASILKAHIDSEVKRLNPVATALHAVTGAI